jgi:hypothetical protein
VILHFFWGKQNFPGQRSQKKSGKVTDLSEVKEGQTVNMMQMSAIVGANIEES